jgi:hypothetical protein
MSETGARDVLPPLSFDLAKEAMAIHLQSPVFSEKENAGNTIGSLDELTTINRNGFITINSQEGVISQGFNEESKRFWKIKERGYLTGFMRLSRGGKFINWINSNTDKIAFLTAIVNYEDFEATFTRRDAYRGSAPLESFFPSIAVTLQGSSETSFEDIVDLFCVGAGIHAVKPRKFTALNIAEYRKTVITYQYYELGLFQKDFNFCRIIACVNMFVSIRELISLNSFKYV